MSALQENTRSNVPLSNSCNDEAQQIEKHLEAIGIKKLSPAELEERRLQREIISTSKCCWQCRKPFAQGDVIYLPRIRDGYTFMGRDAHRVVPMCRSCKPPRTWGYQSPEPCQCCGRPVAIRVDGIYRKRVACGDDCRAKIEIALQKQKRLSVQHLPAVTCQQCGAEFGGRADARFCSSPCRQKAYRARKASI